MVRPWSANSSGPPKLTGEQAVLGLELGGEPVGGGLGGGGGRARLDGADGGGSQEDREDGERWRAPSWAGRRWVDVIGIEPSGGSRSPDNARPLTGPAVRSELPIRKPRRLMELMRPRRHSDSPPARGSVAYGCGSVPDFDRLPLLECGCGPVARPGSNAIPPSIGPPHPAPGRRSVRVHPVSAVDAAEADPTPRDPAFRCSPWTQAQGVDPIGSAGAFDSCCWWSGRCPGRPT